MGKQALLQAAVSVHTLKRSRCGLRLRGRDRVRVFILQNNLPCFVARSHSPQIRFLLNDGVEPDGIFEVFSQSVFLHGNGGNGRFGFEKG